MSFLKCIKNKGKMFGYTIVYLMLNYTTANATEVPCKHQKLNEFDTYCAQTARQEYLEKTWDFLKMVPESKESKSQVKPIRETITKELDENKTMEILDNNLPVKWPRPKTITRYFETAVASLDTDGKKDLKSCTTHGLINSNQVLNIPDHQLQALIYFSDANFKEIKTSNSALNSSFSLESCSRLINLVLGRT